jgi:hypothetical protein
MPLIKQWGSSPILLLLLPSMAWLECVPHGFIHPPNSGRRPGKALFTPTQSSIQTGHHDRGPVAAVPCQDGLAGVTCQIQLSGFGY